MLIVFSVYLNVLQPLEIDEFVGQLKTNGIKLPMKEVINFLDDQVTANVNNFKDAALFSLYHGTHIFTTSRDISQISKPVGSRVGSDGVAASIVARRLNRN
jgi:hypothetical protein